MAFTKYQNTNNASSLLIADISASATTMLITDGDQNLFPSKFPFLLTLEHLDSEGNVILREIVKATASNQNSFTIVRGAGTCVQDDTASNRSQDNTAHAFYSGDRVSLYRTAEQVKDIQDRLETSSNDTAIADEYSSSQTYAIGDIVMYKGDRYVCSTDVSTAEEFDSTKRTKVSVQYDLGEAQDDISNHETRIGTLENQIADLGAPIFVNVVMVGGGGSGGRGGSHPDGAGGGGAGGVIDTPIQLSVGTRPIVIGSGGSNGADGQPTKFFGLTALGGGAGGGAGAQGHGAQAGYIVGSGGGNGGPNAYMPIGLQGNNGFLGTGRCSNCRFSGGGGGGYSSGGYGTDCYNIQINGGYGYIFCINGAKCCIAGGGGASAYGSLTRTAGCGLFGGGDGAPTTNSQGCPATSCGSGGGGGGCLQYGGAGGGGAVYIQYPESCGYNITGGTKTICNGIVSHIITSSTNLVVAK